jgi:hypothetical protein
MGKRMAAAKLCFSKKLLIADYAILVLLIVAFFIPSVDTSNLSVVLCAWIAQIDEENAAAE